VSKVAEDAWKKGERLGEVTGVPTRDHWKVSLFFVFLSVARFFCCFKKEERKRPFQHKHYVLSGGVTMGAILFAYYVLDDMTVNMQHDTEKSLIPHLLSNRITQIISYMCHIERLN
jgi:hypothetical protein